MADAPDKVPERTAGDYAHTAAKAALSTIPGLGGPAAELFALVIAPPLERRRDAWLQDLYERLKKLETEVEGFRIEDLAKHETFVSAVLQVTQIAMRTHQEEKLEALRNALLNSIRLKSIDGEKQVFFFGLIDLFTATHIEVLRLFEDPVTFSVLRRQQLGSRRSLTDPIVLDLNLRSLVTDPRPFAARARESSESLVSFGWTLSPLGREFMKFISAPSIGRQ